jgi:hypothetical protein
MGQLELFSRSQIAAVRDRAASRNYSPERDAFRREHERHREWGLRQRHGRRLMYLRIYGDIAAPADRTTGQPATEPRTPAPVPPSEPVGGIRPAVAASHPDGGEPSCGRDAGSSEVHPADESACAAVTASARRGDSAGEAEPIDRLERRDRAESTRPTSADQVSAVGRLGVAGRLSPDGECRRADRATASSAWLQLPGRPRRRGSARSAGRPSVRPGYPARSLRPRPPRRHLAGQAKRSAPTDDRAPPAASGTPPARPRSEPT